jgi:hypothetical protein
MKKENNMNRKVSIAGGVILILLGGLFLVSEIFPQAFNFWDWPFIIIGLGVIFLLWAILSTTGGLAVPGAILSGIGGILYYQNMTGDWDSWAYIWALIPGFVGTGIILSGVINRNLKKVYTGGLILILISAIMFFAFGSHFGLQNDIARYWPALLILLGIFALVRALFTGKKSQE